MAITYLKWTNPHGGEEVCPLTAEEVLIGRKSDADIVLANPYVSRHHAKLVKQQAGYCLIDLKSTHGTYVNGQRIEEHHLQPGDRIYLGQDRMELLYFTEDLETSRMTVDQEIEGLEKSFINLKSILPSEPSEYSDLEKISSILDFQYQWGKTFSPEKTFDQILLSALKISGAERGFILLKQEEGFEYVVGMDGQGCRLSQSEFQTSRSVVRQVASDGKPVFMEEGIAGEFAQQESIVAMRLRAIACVPLRWMSSRSDAASVQGILYLDSTKTMHALSGLDEKILNKLALEAGNVFEKLEMIKSIEEHKSFEGELALAQETQKSLLPQSLPELTNFHIYAFSQPTRYLGGDFYDFIPLPSGEWLGILADVSGKGISASLLSSLLQGALHVESRSGVEPEEALNHINKFLCEKTPVDRFVTLFLFALNAAGHGKFISAGHNPAYLFRAASGQIDELHSDGLILGAFEFASYRSCPLQLHPGDILVVYSDGVTEACNPEGEMFGEERLISIIQEEAPVGGSALKERILSSVKEFTRGMAQTDDVTFVLIDKYL
jgi:serine phosphatase RsbU (regulator of sigma subunit)/pSer/pThr/pTyr-binding forkhead associated (FHA) protein